MIWIAVLDFMPFLLRETGHFLGGHGVLCNMVGLKLTRALDKRLKAVLGNHSPLSVSPLWFVHHHPIVMVCCRLGELLTGSSPFAA